MLVLVVLSAFIHLFCWLFASIPPGLEDKEFAEANVTYLFPEPRTRNGNPPTAAQLLRHQQFKDEYVSMCNHRVLHGSSKYPGCPAHACGPLNGCNCRSPEHSRRRILELAANVNYGRNPRNPESAEFSAMSDLI